MWKTIMENNLMKTGNEGRSTITKIFKNHNLRFIEIDGERMCIVKDINDALGLYEGVCRKIVSRNLTEFSKHISYISINKNEMLNERSNQPSAQKTMIVDQEGLVKLLHLLEVDRTKMTEEQKQNVVDFKNWSAETDIKMITAPEQFQITPRCTSIDIVEGHLLVAANLVDYGVVSLENALLTAYTNIQSETGINMHSWIKTITGTKEQRFLKVGEIAMRFGIKSSKQMNNVMYHGLCLQTPFMDGKQKRWEPTPEGKQHAVLVATSKKSNLIHPYYIAGWKDSVINFIKDKKNLLKS